MPGLPGGLSDVEIEKARTMNQPAIQYPEILEELHALATAVLVEKGLAPPVAEEVAHAIAQRVRKEWGGSSIYIPRGTSMDVEEMRRIIAARWDGKNTRDLSHELGITERRLRQLAVAAQNFPLGF